MPMGQMATTPINQPILHYFRDVFPLQPGNYRWWFYLQSLSSAFKRSIWHQTTDEAALKMLPYITKNIALIGIYDQSYWLSDSLVNIAMLSPPVTWVVITEGWCGDAAFNVPLLAAVERAFPEEVNLRLFLRDSNLELMDANLTDCGRSIPKLVVLDQD